MPSAVRDPRRDDPLDPIFVSPNDAARLLGLSRSQVYTLIRNGDLECRRQGTRLLVVYASVREFAATLPEPA